LGLIFIVFDVILSGNSECEEFLGLDWEAQLENYRDTVLERGRIHTPSYSQIVQPLYKDASYRWKNYKKYLEKYFDKIEPWVDELGYEL